MKDRSEILIIIQLDFDRQSLEEEETDAPHPTIPLNIRESIKTIIIVKHILRKNAKIGSNCGHSRGKMCPSN